MAHCGNSMAGMFIFTLNCVDLATGWVEQRAVWGKGETGVKDAMESSERALPFPILGFDCDNIKRRTTELIETTSRLERVGKLQGSMLY